MSPEQVNLSLCHLRLGITNVGLWVISALSGLFWLERGSASGFGLGSLVFLFVGMIAVQALFDYLGGVR